jgi:hypothetical protein
VGKKMSINNFELTFNGQSFTTADLFVKQQNNFNENQDERLIRAKDGKAEALVKKDAMCLTSGGTNGVIINTTGTTIDGRIHLAKGPSEIRINGFWKLNDELLTTLPSTLYTPIPVLVYDDHPGVVTIQSLCDTLVKLFGG